MRYFNLFVFGDSVSFGKYDEKGGWVQRLKEKINPSYINKKGADLFNFFNLSIPGNDSQKLLGRVEPEMVSRLHNDTSNVIFIAVGLNDKSDEKLFSNLEKILLISKNYSRHVYLVIYFKIDKNAVSKLCRKLEVKCINVYSYILPHMSDSKHPNSVGHKLISERVFKEIKV